MITLALLALVAQGAHAVPPELTPDPDIVRVEGGLHVQPEQARDYPCNRNLDCASPPRSFYAGSLRASYERPEVWSGALTLALGHSVDFEERPRGGYQVLSLRVDVQLELGRARGEVGAALRVSQALAAGWSSDGTAFGVDFPGVALLIGTRELWGEVQIPTLPTHADPRRFYGGVGWRTESFALEGGIAQLGGLGYQREEVVHAGSNFGVWAKGTIVLGPAWEAGAQLAIGYPFIVGVSLAYRVAQE